MNKPQPCRVCNAEPVIGHRQTAGFYWFHRCEDFYAEGNAMFKNFAEAVAAWNEFNEQLKD